MNTNHIIGVMANVFVWRERERERERERDLRIEFR